MGIPLTKHTERRLEAGALAFTFLDAPPDGREWLLYKARFSPGGWYRPNKNGYGYLAWAGWYSQEDAEAHANGCSGEVEAVRYDSQRFVEIAAMDDHDLATLFAMRALNQTREGR